MTASNLESLVPVDLDAVRSAVESNMHRVAKLGNWPAWIDPVSSLLGRVPTPERRAPGFDAGIACCLDLIPREKQGLSARLHAAWSLADVELLRRDTARFRAESVVVEAWKTLDPDAESTWWLYACTFCEEEGGVSPGMFKYQIQDFRDFANDPNERARMAAGTLFDMLDAFSVEKSLAGCEGVAFASRDGGMQAAYMAGHDLAVHFTDGIYLIGTPKPSLGLESFTWETGKDSQGRTTSGPIHGSKQFVKAANEPEMVRAVRVARDFLASQK